MFIISSFGGAVSILDFGLLRSNQQIHKTNSHKHIKKSLHIISLPKKYTWLNKNGASPNTNRHTEIETHSQSYSWGKCHGKINKTAILNQGSDPNTLKLYVGAGRTRRLLSFAETKQ